MKKRTFNAIAYNLFILSLLFSITFNAAAFAYEYSLNELYEIALKNSEKIKISEEELGVSKTGKDKAVAAFLPTVTAYGQYYRYNKAKYNGLDFMNYSLSFPIQPEHTLIGGVKLEETISLGGAQFSRLDISKRMIEKSGFELYTAKETFLYDVTSWYFNVLKAKKSVTLAENNAERLKTYKKSAETKLKAGEITKTALLRAKAELSGALAELLKAQNDLSVKTSALARNIGINGDFSIAEYTTSQKTNEAEIEAILSACKTAETTCLVDAAMNERTEVKAAVSALEMTKKQITYAKSAFLPSVTLEGVYQKRDDSPSTTDTMPPETMYGAVMLSFPIFEGGLRYAEVSEAVHKKNQSELALLDLKKSLENDVEASYYTFLTLKKTLTYFKEQLDYASENYYAVTKQFNAGLATSLDVIDANNLLTLSEKQYSDAYYDLSLSTLKLKRSTGLFLKSIPTKRTD
ncbi:MAG: TolC family protein [Nitrospirae bacterium]|nr:TolC family protein [Nitrospirota bacterium]MBF0535033.1 TolC family protein [Nitrospirota bacterium]MBF0616541.1 TolC family protein [Nitrospirota bacterium]